MGLVLSYPAPGRVPTSSQDHALGIHSRRKREMKKNYPESYLGNSSNIPAKLGSLFPGSAQRRLTGGSGLSRRSQQRVLRWLYGISAINKVQQAGNGSISHGRWGADYPPGNQFADRGTRPALRPFLFADLRPLPIQCGGRWIGWGDNRPAYGQYNVVGQPYKSNGCRLVGIKRGY